MMLLATLWDVALFALATFGLGAALAPRAVADPLRRFAAGIVVAIGGQFAIGFACFAAGVSNPATAMLLAVAASLLLVVRRSAVVRLGREPTVRTFLAGWAVFSAWSLGLLALVVTYSGGSWVADWVEHWQRTEFFVERQPLNTMFAATYTLTARPPLVNLLVALWLEGTARTFAHYQVFMTLLGSLVLLPAWILTRRWTAQPHAIGWAMLVLMLNPLVAQNLTFAWTKLPTAFLVLCALCFALRGLAPGGTLTERIVATVCLGLGLLAHYSAGPWAVAMALAWLGTGRRSWTEPAFWRESVLHGAIVCVVMAGWLGWAAVHFGWEGTTGSNSTSAHWRAQTSEERWRVPLRNIRDTVVPFPLRGEPRDNLITQRSTPGRARDVAFNVYQLNLPFAFGLAGLWMFATRFRQSEPRPPAAPTEPAVGRAFYWLLLPTAIVLGILVVTPRDEWGLAHICLQPLVLLGLARIAAWLASAAPAHRAIWAIFALVDGVAGIALHFAIQSGALEADLSLLSRAARANAADKRFFHLEFFADALGAPPLLAAGLLAVLVAGVCFALSARSERAHAPPQT